MKYITTYIYKRASSSIFLNRERSFNKICLASEVLQACKDYSKKHNFKELQATIYYVYAEAARIEGRKDTELSPKPYGYLGRCMIAILRAIDPALMQSYDDHDAEVKSDRANYIENRIKTF